MTFNGKQFCLPFYKQQLTLHPPDLQLLTDGAGRRKVLD